MNPQNQQQIEPSINNNYDVAAIPSQVGLFRLPNKSPIPGLYFASAWTYPGHGFGGTIISGYLCARQVHKFLNI
ncbi:MAG: FAD-dependent oxidoreductase, partial [Dolichospermum sp.]